MSAPSALEPFLAIRDLVVDVPPRHRGAQPLTLVHGIDLDVWPGERVALVGESGSGKSMTAKAVLGLDRTVRASGSIRLGGHQVIGAGRGELRSLRGTVAAMVFQDPGTALNPVLTIGQQVAEPLLVRGVPRRTALRRAAEMLDRLGVPRAAERLGAYPGEFSGGMRQRVVMAAALVGQPTLLIADEPTTALDVRVQETVLDLIVEMSEELDLAVLLITHDLGIVAGFADRVAVMRHGRIVETAPVVDIFERPAHPYTRGLIGSVPSLDADVSRPLLTVADAVEERA